MRREAYWKIFLKRFIIAAILVAATYNAGGWSYYHWVQSGFEGLSSFMGALKVVVGALIAVAYLILLNATWRAKGLTGIVIFLLIMTLFVWLAWTTGFLNLSNPGTSTIIAQLILTLLLALGSTWSILWRRLTGQVAVEDPDTVGEA